jgi:hypothetical protein
MTKGLLLGTAWMMSVRVDRSTRFDTSATDEFRHAQVRRRGSGMNLRHWALLGLTGQPKQSFRGALSSRAVRRLRFTLAYQNLIWAGATEMTPPFDHHRHRLSCCVALSYARSMSAYRCVLRLQVSSISCEI